MQLAHPSSFPSVPGRIVRNFLFALALLLVCAWSASVWAVDVNRASLEQLQTISGIGPKMAQAIVEERNRGGDFASMADLSDRVKGIGAKRAQALQAAGLEIGQAGVNPAGTPSAGAQAAAAKGS